MLRLSIWFYTLVDEQVMWDGGLSFHSLITYLAAGCMCVGVLLSLLSIWQHATTYTKPYEQRQ
jgi:2-keto-3-deoxy-6-phosphogluconate aldolase